MPDLFSDNQEPAHQHNFSSTGINQKTIMRLPTSSHRWRSLLSSLLLLWNAKCFTSAQADTSKNPPKDPIRVVGRKIKVTDANGQLLTVDIPDNIWNIAKDDKKKLIDKTIQWQFVDTQGTQDAPPPVNDDYLRVMRVKKPWTDTERRQVERMALTRFYEAVGASALIDSRAPYCSWQGIRCFEPPGSERDYLMHAIDLSFQRLSGTLPTELVLMLDLKFLNVTGNRLQGSLPTEYLHMSKLQEVRLARNQFTSLPLASADDMQKPLAPLKVLDAASNPLSEFSLPKKWHPAWKGLVHLDLSNTFVNGSLFVDSLPPNLEALWLGHNVLTGTLPRDLGKLFRLHTLDLGSNALTGTLPKSGLPSFETLILAQNAFAGPVEEFIRQLQSSSPNLMSLQLKNNSLTGSLPQDGWSGLKQLGTLTLSQNSINGSIPTDFYLNVQSNLRYLDVSRNQLTGTIPTELGLLKKLKNIDVSSNKLEGTLPNEMLDMEPNLRLNFTDNLITGTIPALFCGIGTQNMLYREFGCDAVLCRPGTFSPFGHATLHSACRACPDDTDGVMGRISCTGVDFVHGDLDGDGILSAREVLRMLYIDLIGRFWGSIFQPWADVSVNECDLAGITCNRDGKINKIDLTNANLCSDGERRPGPIRYCKGLPSELGTLSNSLEVLQTNTCQFLRGSIPTELGLLSKLQILDMTGCSSLTGKIPTELGQLSKLRFLFLSHCRLHGSLPSQIFNLPSLAKLHVTNNLLTGTLPPSIGNLKDLRELMISRNGLNGSIPKEIGGAIELENIEAYHNDLEQSIPTEIGQCSNLKRMDIFNNKLTGTIPEELSSVSVLQILHLKNNMLEGTIPENLGELSLLSWLDLSNNRLYGTIPPSFGACRTIKDFRVSGNMIYDPIPPELCKNGNINGGATKLHGCDGILCPLGTYSDSGHAVDEVGCTPCPNGETTMYLGSTGCLKLSEEDILTIFFNVMEGENWPDDMKKNWGDSTIGLCNWAGISCDGDGQIESLSFPLHTAE